MFVIRKKFKFEMSHVLNTSYSVDCQQVHGHSYILEVFLKSAKLNKDGMVTDFGLVKDNIKQLVSEYDHKIIISGDHPCLNEWLALSSAMGKGFVFVNYNPTAEEMARDIFTELEFLIHNLYKIRLHETDTGYAEYFREG